MKKFRLFISSILGALMFVVALSACSPKKVIEDYTIDSVSVNGIYSTYHTSDTVNFSNVTVDVNFKNGSKLTLTHGEVDIDKENAKEGTEFIADESVQNPSRLLRIHEVIIYIPRVFQRLFDRALAYLVELYSPRVTL